MADALKEAKQDELQISLIPFLGTTDAAYLFGYIDGMNNARRTWDWDTPDREAGYDLGFKDGYGDYYEAP